MAKAEQACLNADWRIQALHKQRCDDLQRSECYQEVARLLRENRRKETEVLNSMMGEEAKKWQEAEEKDFHLKSEKKASALSDASRKWFLQKEINDALEHAEHPCTKGVPRYQNGQVVSTCLSRTSQLNDISEADSSTCPSFSQRRIQWDTTERDLMERVRNLRQRLTVQARNRCQTPHLLVT